MSNIHARVITASTRAAAGEYADTAGPLTAAALAELGCDVDPVVVVADGPPVARAIADALRDCVDVVITTGGTGLAPMDLTPQITAKLIDYEVPGIADLIRTRSWDQIPSAALSRGIAGVAGTTLIVNLPGSEGGVRDGMTVLRALLVHAVDQIRGGDHVRSSHAHSYSAVTSSEVLAASITDQPIDVNTHEILVAGPERGAVVGFAGVVRDHDHGRAVVELEYSSHPRAEQIICDVANEAAARAGVCAVAVTHRVGKLAIGDTALACAVAAEHRVAAFETCAWLVDEVKARLPIWKRQQFADGTYEWVNCP